MPRQFVRELFLSRIGRHLRRWHERHDGLETSVGERPGEESKLGTCSGGTANQIPRCFEMFRSWDGFFFSKGTWNYIPNFWGFKQCKSMAFFLRDFPLMIVHCLGWCHI